MENAKQNLKVIEGSKQDPTKELLARMSEAIEANEEAWQSVKATAIVLTVVSFGVGVLVGWLI